MRLKTGFIQRKIAGENVLIPTGAENIRYHKGIITTNNSAAYLCNLLNEDQTEKSLVEAVLEKYEVSQEQALKDVKKLLSVMSEHHMLYED